MKKNLARIIGWFTMLFLPAIAFAQGLIGRGLSDVSSPFSGVSPSSVRDVPTFIAFVIRILLFIGGGVAVLFIIIGGYQYLTSMGNEEQAEQGKKTLINAVIGIVLIVLSYVIINAVLGTISRSY